MKSLKEYLPYLVLGLAMLGIADAGYLTYEHFSGVVPPCSIHWWSFSDCGKVLQSSYAVMFGVPLALFGVLQYSAETILATLIVATKQRLWKVLLLIASTLGFLFSLYFVYLMLFVIHAICLYCMGSAVISTLIFVTVWVGAKQETVEAE